VCLYNLSHNRILNSHVFELLNFFLFNPFLFFLQLKCSDFRSQILFLGFNERKDDDGKDKIEQEELPDKNHYHTVDTA
jgi:hypothetical protein